MFDVDISIKVNWKLYSQNFFISAQRISICSRKGVFPYEYIDYVEKLEKTELSSHDFFLTDIIIL